MRKLFGVVFMVVALVSFLVPDASAQKKVLIAVSFANQINQGWIKMGKGVKEECQKLNYNLIVVDAEDKPAKQISDTEDALAKKPDVLLLTGVDSSAAQLVAMAEKRGIPCINLGRNYGNPTAFIGADNYTTGVMFVDYHAKLAAGKEWKFIAITGTPGAASSVEREKGFDATLPKYPNLKVLARQAGYYRRDKTLPVAEDLLQTHRDVQGIMGWNDEIGMGALAAVKSQNRKGIVITGGDGNKDFSELILKGELEASLMYDLKGIGHVGVQTAAKVIKGEKVEKVIHVPQVWITKANVEEFLKGLK